MKPRAAKPRVWPAYLALVITLVSPFVYMMTIDNAFLRSTGIVWFGVIGVGVVLGLITAARTKRWAAYIPLGFNLALAAFWFYGFFGMTALPAAEAKVVVGSAAPDFTLNDENGQPVVLREVVSAGPVLLVFFQGHW